MPSQTVPIAILGSGNIGTDLMYKMRRNPLFDIQLVSGIDPASEGLARARELGYATSTDGVEAVLEDRNIKLVLEATSARTHVQNAPRLRAAGKIVIDLTPAKVGPSVVPCVNMHDRYDEPNVNMISCGAQATIPIVYGISRVVKVKYAEIVATVSSASAGPGTRQNIDEFTNTTRSGLEEVGGAESAKAIIVLNPAEPPIIMRNTVYAVVEGNFDEEEVRTSIMEMVSKVQSYVPGYQITVQPFLRRDHFMVGIEVKGAGEYLPTYAGNLDIMTAAAVAVAERYASSMLN